MWSTVLILEQTSCFLNLSYAYFFGNTFIKTILVTWVKELGGEGARTQMYNYNDNWPSSRVMIWQAAPPKQKKINKIDETK